MKHILLTTLALITAALTATAVAPGGWWHAEEITPDIIRVVYSDAAPSKPSLVEHQAAKTSVNSRQALSTLVTDGGIAVVINGQALTIESGEGRVINIPRYPATNGNLTTMTINGADPAYSIYGCGERGHSLNFTGDTIVNYNRQNYGYTEGDPRISQMNITMPLLISSQGYALLFDDYSPTKLIFGSNGSIKYESTSRDSQLSFYFVKGDSPKALANRLTSLTGRQEMPPLWSLGYITSKYGYRNQAETTGVIDTLKRTGYPVDGIVLDLYWYGKEEDMGSLSWAKEQWPNHRKMLADLKKKGVNLVAISQPYVLKNGRGIDNYNELSASRMFGLDSLGNTHDVKIWVGEGGMLDVSNPETRQWLRRRYRSLTDEGITGWWGDLGEPEVHPETMIHANGLTAPEYHNRYGNQWSEIIYDLFKEEYPETRLMTLMRGGTIGLQRYSVFPWSTDVSRSWGGLQPQIKIMINSGMSGLGYMSHDVGGFAVDPANPVDPELYVRWLQLGTFSPVLRTHATVDAEPYKYPQYRHIILPLIKERYRWLPYNYTLAYENATLGYPLVRPCNFGNPTDPMPEDQYLWGDNVLVAPVIEQGAVSREITFPSGTWVDISNPSATYQGVSTITYDAPLEVLPMFVRAGSLIPTADYPMKNTGDYDTSRYTVNYYPVNGLATTTGGYIYEDDLSTPNDGAGKGTVIMFKANENGTTSTIDITTPENGLGKDTVKKLDFKIYNVGHPKSVTLNGKPMNKMTYDAKSKVLTIRVNYKTGDADCLTIKY